jgi:hypothetical protein
MEKSAWRAACQPAPCDAHSLLDHALGDFLDCEEAAEIPPMSLANPHLCSPSTIKTIVDRGYARGRRGSVG